MSNSNLGIVFIFVLVVVGGLYHQTTSQAQVPKRAFGTEYKGSWYLDLAKIEVLSSQPVIEIDPPNSILFTGDIMLGRNVETLIRRHGFGYPFKNLTFMQDKPTYLVGNFEAVVPKIHKQTPDFNTVFSVDSDFLPILKSSGFTHLSLANNHTNDFKQEGFLNTKEEMNRNGLESFGQPDGFGTSSVSFVEVSDETVALIAINLVAKPLDPLLIQDLVIWATTQSDFQVALIHWGDEYVSENNSFQDKQAQLLVASGVDLIVGHHPHVVQSVRLVDNVLVFYSLGNFIFDQYFSSAVRQGLVLQLLKESPGRDHYQVMLYPVSSLDKHAQPSLMTKADSQRFLKRLSQISEETLTNEILAGVIDVDRHLQIEQ